jgi:predicted nucleic acid-binding protein
VILPDTNIWIDHLRRPDNQLAALMMQKRVRLHPFVLGEIALGLQGAARSFIALIGEVTSTAVAKPHEMLVMIEARELHGTGIGYVDAHLLAATLLDDDGQLWTRDKRLHAQAARLGVAYAP